MQLVKHFSFGWFSSKVKQTNKHKTLLNFSSIDKQLNNSIARNYALLSLFNVGLFRSSTSFINNSFSMYTLLFAYSFWFSNALSVNKIEREALCRKWIFVVLVCCVFYCIRIFMWMDLCGCSWVISIFEGIDCVIDWNRFSVPIAIDIVFRRKRLFDFVKWSLISALITLVRLY